MKSAFVAGTKTAPFWIMTLWASEAWGIPPWEVSGGNRLQWYLRFSAYKQIEAEAIEEKRNG